MTVPLEAGIDYQQRMLRRTCAALQIGIDPRAASATRALLRLTPCHRACLRPARGETSGIPGSLELTGGLRFIRTFRIPSERMFGLYHFPFFVI
jgi:hypothetical protein